MSMVEFTAALEGPDSKAAGAHDAPSADEFEALKARYGVGATKDARA